MINLLSYAVFEKYQDFQLLPSLEKKLNDYVLLGSIKSYEIINATTPAKAVLRLVDYTDATAEFELEYKAIHKEKRIDIVGSFRSEYVDITDHSKKYYSVVYTKYEDIDNPYKKYSNFVEKAYDTYLKSRQVKTLKVGDVEIKKEEIIHHVSNLPTFKKLMNDFDLVNVTTKGEAKNGTLSFYYKYAQEGRMQPEPPYAMFKISGKGGNLYDTAGNGHTVVKYGPMQTIEDYEKALNGLYDYLLNTYWRKRLKKFRKELLDNPYLQTSHPGEYKMMKRFDNPDLFRNDKLRNLINTGLFN